MEGSIIPSRDVTHSFNNLVRMQNTSRMFTSRRRIILCVLRNESGEVVNLSAAPLHDVQVLERRHDGRLYSKTVLIRGGDEIGVRVKLVRLIVCLHVDIKECFVYSKFFRLEKMKIYHGQCEGGGYLFQRLDNACYILPSLSHE